jgi:hypothetical protein
VDVGPTFHFDAYLDADPAGHPDVDQNTVQAFDLRIRMWIRIQLPKMMLIHLELALDADPGPQHCIPLPLHVCIVFSFKPLLHFQPGHRLQGIVSQDFSASFLASEHRLIFYLDHCAAHRTFCLLELCSIC